MSTFFCTIICIDKTRKHYFVACLTWRVGKVMELIGIPVGVIRRLDAQQHCLGSQQDFPESNWNHQAYLSHFPPHWLDS